MVLAMHVLGSVPVFMSLMALLKAPRFAGVENSVRLHVHMYMLHRLCRYSKQVVLRLLYAGG